MCGIVGYIGPRKADDLLLSGLQRLEYRGYDSVGIAIVEREGSLVVRKQKGKVSGLVQTLGGGGDSTGLDGTLGIGHTRWATHGVPSDVNSHPHVSAEGDFALVHNGIIENYAALKERLQREGYVFQSQTDTEVLVHLVDSIRKATGNDLVESLRQALTQVVGTYGIALVTSGDDDLLIGARKGSPLLIGIGDGEYILASDAAPLVGHTSRVVYLNDGEMVVLRRDGYEVTAIEGGHLDKEVIDLEMDLEQIEKGGYEHFMLKEIMEQPESLENAMRGRLRLDDNQIVLGGLLDVLPTLRAANRILICACGTSWHAALVGEYLIEGLARIPVEVDYASEFRYRNPILRDGDVMLVISQSGETADTLAAVREARQKGIPVYGIVNSVGSTIARETDAGVYLHAGPEIGVASTKAFTAQVTVLTMLALKLGRGPHDDRRRDADGPRSTLRHPGEDPRGAQGRWRGREDGAGLPLRAELPLPRARQQLSGGPGGRAQAQGDQLHPRRGLPGSRDEARPDRPHRPVHARRLHRHARLDLRQGRLEHRGGRRAAGQRDRHHRRGQPRPRPPLRVRDPHPDDRRVPDPAPHGHPAPAARVPHRRHARLQRRPAPQPRQERDRGVTAAAGAPPIVAPPPHAGGGARSFRAMCGTRDAGLRSAGAIFGDTRLRIRCPPPYTARPYVLAETTWEAVRAAPFDVAVLPWGATEAHNRHLPYATDNIQAEAIAAEAARIAWEAGTRVVVLPAVPFGVQTGQRDLPLCLNLNPSTQALVLADLAASVADAGVGSLVVLNGHGGNDFRQTIRELQPRFPDLFLCQVHWWKVGDAAATFDVPGDHAGELETSVTMHLTPHLVRPLDEAGPGHERRFRIAALREGWAWAPRAWTEATDDTGVGDPAAATPEKGARYTAEVAHKLAAFFADLARADPSDRYA